MMGPDRMRGSATSSPVKKDFCSPPPSPIEENISHGTVTITSLPTIYLVKTSSQSEDKLGTYMGPIKLKRKVCSNTHKLSLKLYRVML